MRSVTPRWVLLGIVEMVETKAGAAPAPKGECHVVPLAQAVDPQQPLPCRDGMEDRLNRTLGRRPINPDHDRRAALRRGRHPGRDGAAPASLRWPRQAGAGPVAPGPGPGPPLGTLRDELTEGEAQTPVSRIASSLPALARSWAAWRLRVWSSSASSSVPRVRLNTWRRSAKRCGSAPRLQGHWIAGGCLGEAGLPGLRWCRAHGEGGCASDTTQWFFDQVPGGLTGPRASAG